MAVKRGEEREPVSGRVVIGITSGDSGCTTAIDAGPQERG